MIRWTALPLVLALLAPGAVAPGAHFLGIGQVSYLDDTFVAKIQCDPAPALVRLEQEGETWNVALRYLGSYEPAMRPECAPMQEFAWSGATGDVHAGWTYSYQNAAGCYREYVHVGPPGESAQVVVRIHDLCSVVIHYYELKGTARLV